MSKGKHTRSPRKMKRIMQAAEQIEMKRQATNRQLIKRQGGSK